MAGRPRSFDRDAALAVAVEQFWRVGYEECSIAALTSAMGLTPPSLYAAFGDKSRLFEEASALYFQRTCDGIDEAVALPTVHEAIAMMLESTARAHADPATPLGCLMLTEPRLRAQREEIHRRLTLRLAQGVRDHDLPPTASPEDLASFLVAVMHGMSSRARDGATTDELLGIARLALAALPTAAAAARRAGTSRRRR